jgi:hypothetical protein
MACKFSPTFLRKNPCMNAARWKSFGSAQTLQAFPIALTKGSSDLLVEVFSAMLHVCRQEKLQLKDLKLTIPAQFTLDMQDIYAKVVTLAYSQVFPEASEPTLALHVRDRGHGIIPALSVYGRSSGFAGSQSRCTSSSTSDFGCQQTTVRLDSGPQFRRS